MARSSASARALTDHDEIREWAEERNATPACVKGTGGDEDVGMIRLDFPGYSGAGSLEPIEWDVWLQKFDESNLALMVQDETADGQRSNFNKLVSKDSVEKSGRSRQKKSKSSGGRKPAGRKTSRDRDQAGENTRISAQRVSPRASSSSRTSAGQTTARGKKSASSIGGRSRKKSTVRASSSKRRSSSSASRRSGRKAA